MCLGDEPEPQAAAPAPLEAPKPAPKVKLGAKPKKSLREKSQNGPSKYRKDLSLNTGGIGAGLNIPTGG